MIIAVICIFLSYVVFDQQLKITLRESSGPSRKSPLPPFYSLLSIKFKKCKSPPFLPTLKIFQASPAESGGRTLCNGIDAFYLVPNKTVNKIKLLMISAECILKHFAGIRVTHQSLVLLTLKTSKNLQVHIYAKPGCNGLILEAKCEDPLLWR